jgi:hypothetical protein
MPSEPRPVRRPRKPAVTGRRATLPSTGDKAPCEGYWQPQCKQELPRHLKDGQLITPCRKGHRDELWSLRLRRRKRGAYGRR